MINFRIIILLLLLLVSCNTSQNRELTQEDKSLDFEEKLRLLVLSENRINSKYCVSVESEGILEYSVSYLGNIINNQNDTLRFITFIIYTGLYEDAKRANANFYIYDSDYNNLGSYYVGGVNDLPIKIEDYNLIFNQYSDSTKNNQITKINFRDSIPSQIFVIYQKKEDISLGDIHTFEYE